MPLSPQPHPRLPRGGGVASAPPAVRLGPGGSRAQEKLTLSDGRAGAGARCLEQHGQVPEESARQRMQQYDYEASRHSRPANKTVGSRPHARVVTTLPVFRI